MANQDRDQSKVKPMEQNSNRSAKTGTKGPILKINQTVKKNPMKNGGIAVRRSG